VVLAVVLALFIGTKTGGPLFDFFTRLGDFVDDLVP